LTFRKKGGLNCSRLALILSKKSEPLHHRTAGREGLASSTATTMVFSKPTLFVSTFRPRVTTESESYREARNFSASGFPSTVIVSTVAFCICRRLISVKGRIAMLVVSK
jgi:hypothetical protein